jgi:Secretion system C-terminal sorting domain
MQIKTTIIKNISMACCIALSMLHNKAKAQIIYTDIADATPNATYPLDLNNDGTTDFAIQYAGAQNVVCFPSSSNAYGGNIGGTLHLAYALPSGYNICDTLTTWYDATNPGTMGGGASVGNWPNVTDKYLALKLVVGTNTYYGWARLDFLFGSGSFTVKDYAYESTPNTCIKAGQGPLSIKENASQNIFSIAPNPMISFARITTNSYLKNATVSICNAAGQVVKQVENISGNSLTLFRGDLPSGIYFVQMEEEGKIIAVEKLMVGE